MKPTLVIFLVFIGVVLGSFLNICIDRLPSGKSLMRPNSCRGSWRQLLPAIEPPLLFSFLLPEVHRRYFQTGTPFRMLGVEVLSGLWLALGYWRYGFTAQFLVISFYFYLLLLILFIDLEHRLILNKVVYPAAAVSLAIDAFAPQTSAPGSGILSGLAGGAAGFALLLIPALVYPEGMGWGDVKMAGLIGLITGLSLVPVALSLGIALAATVSAALLLLGLKKRMDVIPFGPFLSLGTFVTLLWGQQILDWYLRLP